MTISADQEAEFKRQSAELAAEMVEDGMVVGLGTGSTAAFAVAALGRRYREGLKFVGIPTSLATERQALNLGIPLSTFAEHKHVDLTIDGADEVQRGTLNLIKGLGGALLREKIVAYHSDRLVIVADERKLVDDLATQSLLPVEVTPFGWEASARCLAELGAHVQPRHSRAGELFISDGGNLILDCRFDIIENPAELEADIDRVVGVVECGLFIGMATEAVIAGPNGIARLHVASS